MKEIAGRIAAGVIILAAILGCGGISTAVKRPAPPTQIAAAPTHIRPILPNRPASTPTANEAVQFGLTGGVVTAVNGNTLDLRIAGATLQVEAAPNALVVVPGVKNPTLADVKTGDRVIANIPGNSLGSPAALLIAIPSQYDSSDLVTGVVQSNVNGSIELKSNTKTMQLTAAALSTVVDVSRDQPVMATLPEVQVNSSIVVIGQNSGSAFTPEVIVIVTQGAGS